MKPCYKIGQRVKIIPYYSEQHKNIPSNTYYVGDTGVIEVVDEHASSKWDYYVYGIRFDRTERVNYAFESMIIPEDFEYTTDNFTTNSNVKRVIGKSATTLLCVTEENERDHVFELQFINY
jgi:hypothetical protein